MISLTWNEFAVFVYKSKLEYLLTLHQQILFYNLISCTKTSHKLFQFQKNFLDVIFRLVSHAPHAPITTIGQFKITSAPPHLHSCSSCTPTYAPALLGKCPTYFTLPLLSGCPCTPSWLNSTSSPREISAGEWGTKVRRRADSKPTLFLCGTRQGWLIIRRTDEQHFNAPQNLTSLPF